MHFSIFRYNPERDEKPYMQDFHVDLEPTERMLLDAILRIRDFQDDSLTIRKSCREGVCGSDAININGRNGLACITPVRELKEPVELRPLIERAQAEHRAVTVNNVEWRTVHGEPCWLDFHIAPLTDSAGTTIGTLISFSELSTDYRLHRELEQSRQELETA